jgi:multidrug resistance efflux pump
MVGWLFKTYLIADTDALIALNEASTLIAAAIVDMAPYRLAVQQVEDDIAIARSGIDSTQRFLDEMRSDIKNSDVQNPTEATLRHVEWAAAQHDAATKQHQEQLHKLESLTNEHAHRVKQLIEKSIVINRNVQKPVRDAHLAARAELEVDVDRSKFASAAATWDARASAKVAQLIALIDEQAAPPPPDLTGPGSNSVDRDRTSKP